jgi:transcriptional regulator with XRE-family HTH domain
MKLSDYLYSKKMTQADFARLLGELPQTVGRYVNGERTPRPKTIQKIALITNGEVDANSFYNLTKKPTSNKIKD